MSSQLASYALCLLMALALCAGQILFKMASLTQTVGSFSFARLLTSPWFLAAACLYALTTVLWVYILTRMPLSLAYSFTLLGAALVPLAAYFIFAEPVGMKLGIGMVFVLAGLYIIHAA
jgi:multidrug transporter EmrE-like cation transporter